MRPTNLILLLVFLLETEGLKQRASNSSDITYRGVKPSNISINQTHSIGTNVTTLEYTKPLYEGWIRKTGDTYIIDYKGYPPQASCRVPYGESNLITLSVPVGLDFFRLSTTSAFGSTEIQLYVVTDLQNSALLFNAKDLHVSIQTECNKKINVTTLLLHLEDFNSTAGENPQSEIGLYTPGGYYTGYILFLSLLCIIITVIVVRKTRIRVLLRILIDRCCQREDDLGYRDGL